MCVFEQLPIYILFFWSCEKKELHIFICDWKDREYSNGNQSQAYPFIIKLLFIAFWYESKVFGNFLFCFRATQSSLSNIRLIWIFLSILCVRACFCVCVCERFRIILHNFSLDVIGIVVCDGVNKNLAWFYQKIMKVILFTFYGCIEQIGVLISHSQCTQCIHKFLFQWFSLLRTTNFPTMDRSALRTTKYNCICITINTNTKKISVLRWSQIYWTWKYNLRCKIIFIVMVNRS